MLLAQQRVQDGGPAGPGREPSGVRLPPGDQEAARLVRGQRLPVLQRGDETGGGGEVGGGGLFRGCGGGGRGVCGGSGGREVCGVRGGGVRALRGGAFAGEEVPQAVVEPALLGGGRRRVLHGLGGPQARGVEAGEELAHAGGVLGVGQPVAVHGRDPVQPERALRPAVDDPVAVRAVPETGGHGGVVAAPVQVQLAGQVAVAVEGVVGLPVPVREGGVGGDAPDREHLRRVLMAVRLRVAAAARRRQDREPVAAQGAPPRLDPAEVRPLPGRALGVRTHRVLSVLSVPTCGARGRGVRPRCPVHRGSPRPWPAQSHQNDQASWSSTAFSAYASRSYGGDWSMLSGQNA